MNDIKKSNILSLFLTFCLLLSIICGYTVPAYGADTPVSNPTLSCEKPFSVFEADEQPTYTLSWENNGSSSAKTISTTVTDYYDEVVFSSSHNTAANDTSYTFSINDLGVGHYRLNAQIGTAETTTAFSVVPVLEYRRDSKELSFGMATMAIRSYKDSKNDTAYKDYVRSLLLAGIYNVRDFGLMREMEKITQNPNDLYCWWVNVYYDPMIKEYADNNIDLTFMYQNEKPTSTNTSSAYIRENHYVPNDLIASYNFAKSLADRYKGQMSAVEIFNEIDASWTQLGTDSPDVYAAFLKASALGVKDANSNIKTVASSLCNGENIFRQRLFENDISSYIDAENYHTYTIYSENADKKGMQKYNDFPAQAYETGKSYGLSDKELYVTEQGITIKTDLDTTELSDAYQKIQARYLATSAVESMASSSDKNYWFKHGYHIEQDGNYYKHFGDMSKDETPYMVYNAISAMTNSLGNGKYIGKFNNLSEGQYGYIFKDGDEEIACLWSDKEASVDIAASCSDAVLIDIMGTEKTITPSNGHFNISTDRDIKYLRIKGSFDVNSYTASTKVERVTSTSEPTVGEKVVILQKFDEEACSQARVHGYNLETNTQNKCTLYIYNFNDFAVSGTVWADIEGGFDLSENKFDINNIAPLSCATITLNLTSKLDAEPLREYRLRFSGSFNGNACSDSVSYVYYTPNSESDFIASDNIISGYTNPENWYKNINSTSTWNAENDASDSDAITLTHNFTGDDLWSMPYLNIPDEYSFADTQGIIFTYKGSRALENAKFYVYLTENSGEIYVASQTADFDGNYKQCTLDYSGFYQTSTSEYDNGVLDLDDIADLRIGFNHKTEGEFTLKLKNIGTYTYKPLNGLYAKSPSYRESDEYFTVYTQIENYSQSNEVGVAIITLTDSDNKLLDIYTQDYSTSPDSVYDISHNFAKNSDIAHVNIFLWKGVAEMTPMYRKMTSTLPS